MRQFATLVQGGRVRSRHELQPLVNLVAHVHPAPVEPLPQFRTYLRERLVYAANNAAVAELASSRSDFAVDAGDAPSRPWREFVPTAAAISLMTGTGAAAASTRAMPGDNLYALKRSVESIQISFASSEQERGGELLERAKHRLKEAERLAARSIQPMRSRCV